MPGSHSPEFDAEAYLDALAAATGLAVRPEHRPGVVRHLNRTEGFARLLADVDLPATCEPAWSFRP